MIDQVMSPPDEPWVGRLRRGHRVWLVKEGHPALIAWAWDPPEPGVVTGTGRIALEPLVNNYVQPVQVWYVCPLGRGIDKSLLLAPIVGQLPEEASPISEPLIRQIKRDHAALLHRLEQLEAEVRRLRAGSVPDWIDPD